MSDLFEWAGPFSGKARCKVCGRTGWGPVTPKPAIQRGDWFSPWQLDCIAGHPYECSICGRKFANKQALSGHLTPRRKKAA